MQQSRYYHKGGKWSYKVAKLKEGGILGIFKYYYYQGRHSNLLQELWKRPGRNLFAWMATEFHAWDGQMFFIAQNGFRVVVHDRRGHGRSTQVFWRNDMDSYADFLADGPEARPEGCHADGLLHWQRRQQSRPIH